MGRGHPKRTLLMKVCPKFPSKVLPPCQSHSNLPFVQLWFICFSSWTYLLVQINRYWSPLLKPILLATVSWILNLGRRWFGELLMLDFDSRKPCWHLTTGNTEIKEVMYKKKKYEKWTSLTRQEVKLLPGLPLSAKPLFSPSYEFYNLFNFTVL